MRVCALTHTTVCRTRARVKVVIVRLAFFVVTTNVFTGVANIIQHMAGLSKYVSPGHFNDPDFIELEWYESATEAQTQIAFWALWAAPFVVATDPRRKSRAMEFLTNAEVVRINQDALVMAGELRLNNSDGSQVWSRPLSGSAPTWAVICYNTRVWPWQSNTPAVAVPFNAAVLPGLPSTANATVTVRDVWAAKDMGKFSTLFHSPPLKPRESRLYVLTLV